MKVTNLFLIYWGYWQLQATEFKIHFLNCRLLVSRLMDLREMWMIVVVMNATKALSSEKKA